jgi:hypothetical protein
LGGANTKHGQRIEALARARRHLLDTSDSNGCSSSIVADARIHGRRQ